MKDDSRGKKLQQALERLDRATPASNSVAATSAAADNGVGRSPRRHGFPRPLSSLAAVSTSAAPSWSLPWTASSLGFAPTPSPPQCRPWDRGDLLRRLATFKSTTWFGKPQIAGPVACACRGWVNVDADLLACESCGSCLTFATPATWQRQQVERAAEEFATKLNAGHKPLCPWQDNPSLETLVCFPPESPSSLILGFRERCEALLQLPVLPSVSAAALENIRALRGEAVDRLLATKQGIPLPGGQDAEDYEFAQYCQSLQLIALCGWEPRLLSNYVDQQPSHGLGSPSRTPHDIAAIDRSILQGSSAGQDGDGTAEQGIVRTPLVRRNGGKHGGAIDFSSPFGALGSGAAEDYGSNFGPTWAVLSCSLCGSSRGLWDVRLHKRPGFGLGLGTEAELVALDGVEEGAHGHESGQRVSRQLGEEEVEGQTSKIGELGVAPQEAEVFERTNGHGHAQAKAEEIATKDVEVIGDAEAAMAAKGTDESGGTPSRAEVDPSSAAERVVLERTASTRDFSSPEEKLMGGGLPGFCFQPWGGQGSAGKEVVGQVLQESHLTMPVGDASGKGELFDLSLTIAGGPPPTRLNAAGDSPPVFGSFSRIPAFGRPQPSEIQAPVASYESRGPTAVPSQRERFDAAVASTHYPGSPSRGIKRAADSAEGMVLEQDAGEAEEAEVEGGLGKMRESSFHDVTEQSFALRNGKRRCTGRVGHSVEKGAEVQLHASTIGFDRQEAARTVEDDDAMDVCMNARSDPPRRQNREGPSPGSVDATNMGTVEGGLEVDDRNEGREQPQSNSASNEKVRGGVEGGSSGADAQHTPTAVEGDRIPLPTRSVGMRLGGMDRDTRGISNSGGRYKRAAGELKAGNPGDVPRASSVYATNTDFSSKEENSADSVDNRPYRMETEGVVNMAPAGAVTGEGDAAARASPSAPRGSMFGRRIVEGEAQSFREGEQQGEYSAEIVGGLVREVDVMVGEMEASKSDEGGGEAGTATDAAIISTGTGNGDAYGGGGSVDMIASHEAEAEAQDGHVVDHFLATPADEVSLQGRTIEEGRDYPPRHSVVGNLEPATDGTGTCAVTGEQEGMGDAQVESPSYADTWRESAGAGVPVAASWAQPPATVSIGGDSVGMGASRRGGEATWTRTGRLEEVVGGEQGNGGEFGGFYNTEPATSVGGFGVAARAAGGGGGGGGDGEPGGSSGDGGVGGGGGDPEDSDDGGDAASEEGGGNTRDTTCGLLLGGVEVLGKESRRGGDIEMEEQASPTAGGRALKEAPFTAVGDNEGVNRGPVAAGSLGHGVLRWAGSGGLGPGLNVGAEVSEGLVEFDPLRQHRHFCPWVNSGGFASSGAAALPGWQQCLDALDALETGKRHSSARRVQGSDFISPFRARAADIDPKRLE